MLIEETLRGGYGGLFHEVTVDDTYRLKMLQFTPEIFYDCGGNIGITARYASELFPNCKIISVEPNKENYDVFRYFTDKYKSIIVINKAIGIGQVWHGLTAANGSGETYLSEGLGYPKLAMEDQEGSSIERAAVQTIMPDELINEFYEEGKKTVFKLDIEGAENIIWDHKPSMDALKKMDYFAAEIHSYGIDGIELEHVKYRTKSALKEFNKTHLCILDGVHFYATKK